MHLLESSLRYLWAAPVSALGLVMACAAGLGGARWQRVNGVLEVCGGWLGRWMAKRTKVQAITVGHVVLGVDASTLSAWRAHEHAHVAQYERWGVLMVPLYLASSLHARMRGDNAYWHNAFEREARIVARRGRMPRRLP